MEPISEKTFRILFVASLFVAGWWLLISAHQILLLFFLSVLIAVFLHEIAEIGSKALKMPYGLSLASLVLSLFIIISLFFWLTGPALVEQTQQFTEKLPEAWSSIRSWFEKFYFGDEILKRFSDGDFEQFQTALSGAQNLAKGLIGSVTALVVVVLMAIFFASEPSAYRRGLLFLFPDEYQGRIDSILTQTKAVLIRWLIGRFASAGIIGVCTYIALLIIDLPLALSLSLFAAAMTFIPNIGPVLSAIPAIMLGFVDGGWTPLTVIFIYIGIQLFESYLVTPMIQKQAIAMPPAIILGSQILFGFLAGLLGVLLAMPIVTTVRTIVKEWRSAIK